MNIIVVSGNLGKDPEQKYSQGGQPITKFSIGVSDRFKDKSGQWQERTEWANIVVFGNQAENCAKYLKKGSKVLVRGSLQTSSWEDKQSGEKKYRTEIKADNVEFLDRKQRDETEIQGDEWS